MPDPTFSFPLPDAETLAAVPLRLAMLFKVLPIEATSTTLTVVTSDATNRTMLSRLSKETGLRVEARMVPAAEVERALKHVYSTQSQARSTTSLPTTSSTSGEMRAPKRGAGQPAPGRGNATTGSIDEDMQSSDSWYDDFGQLATPESRQDQPPTPRPVSEEASVDVPPFIERGEADDDHEDIRTLREDSSASAETIERVNTLLTDAVRMGANEIFIDTMADRFPCRIRIGNRMAHVRDLERNAGSDVLSRLRAMALIGERGVDGCDTGRMDFRLDSGEPINIYLRTFPRHLYECHVMEVIRPPGVKIRGIPARGVSSGSAGKLRELLTTRLRDRKLATKITKQLTGGPTMIAVASPRHRPRESLLAVLAAAVSGPALGLRTVFAGERPRFHLEELGVTILLSDHHSYKRIYDFAGRMSADYLFLEDCKDYEDIGTAMHASATQHVLFGIAASDPTDVLVNLSSAPESRRLAHRLGAILFLDAATMKVVEMTQPLRDAVVTVDRPASFRRIVEREVEEGAPLLGQSMETRVSDVSKGNPLGGDDKE